MANPSRQAILGIEGGATKTQWALCEKVAGETRVVAEGKLGPGSMKLLDRAALQSLLLVLPREADRVGVYLAGCATAADRKYLHDVAGEVWPRATLSIGSDRESGFAAAFGDGDGIAVIAGTGSAVQGRRQGVEERAGGWGHLLGDSGGGYDLAIHALRGMLFDFDTAGHLTPLAADTLRTLGLNSLRELSSWAQTAQKSELARLTPLIFQHANEPDAHEILADGAQTLADLTASVIRRLAFDPPRVRLIGGVFTGQSIYQQLFSNALYRDWPGADIAVCHVPGSLGAVFLAGELSTLPRQDEPPPLEEPGLEHSPTEQVNPRSLELSTLSCREQVELFVEEERFVEEALRHVVPELTAAVEAITECLGAGGRFFYVGAGTSGRLGMLDASEMPPTFGVDPGMVQAIMAGGAGAFQKSAEGAEDSREGGAHSLLGRGVQPEDVVCGIAASGRTPFVLGALQAAREIGARTIFLTCNPARDRGTRVADIEIDLATGPEIISGSTRLKAGTATKLALNILSSVSMVRLGKVDGNLMSSLQPTNRKLKERAARIVADRLEIAVEEARKRLECANWDIQAVLKSRQNWIGKGQFSQDD